MSNTFSQKKTIKKISKSPKSSSSSKTSNKSINNKILIKNNDISLPHFNTQESKFLLTMEQLVSNDKTIREKAAQKAKTYLHIAYSNSEELYQKISRSLFYFFWNTDKPTYQLSMAKLIASFIYINPDEKNKLIPKNRLWISTFLSEMSKKFQSIDALRLDKYIMMVDQVMSTYLNACLENKLFKSVIYLLNYFIRENENNKSNFNFTFEANKIKVLSRFVKLILNIDDKIEGNIMHREEFLNNEESGFATFYKKLLLFYKSIKDKREIKHFQDNIFQTIITALKENKTQKKNLNINNKIKEINESFWREYKNEINGNKNLNMEYFLKKINDEKFEGKILEDKNKEKIVVDPVNDYIMNKKYLQKFRKSKEEIKKERLEKKINKNKIENNVNDDENLEKNKNDENIKNESNKKKKSEKKEKLNKLKNISDELNFDDVEIEKQIIELNEDDEEKKYKKEEIKIKEKEEKEERHLSDKKEKIELLDSVKKNKENINKNQKDSSNKKETQKDILTKTSKEKEKNLSLKNNNINKTHQKNESSSGDDDCLIEDSDEIEEESEDELIEENDDDDSSENPSSMNNSNSKNKEKSLSDFYSDEALDKYAKELMEEEEEELEDDDEDYELNENDLDDLADDMNLMMENYNDKTTLKNTKLNMKQGLLNKKTMRNIKNERKNNNTFDNNKKKKKKITFSIEDNVVSIYNSKIPISLKSKLKNVFVPGETKRQSILKNK